VALLGARSRQTIMPFAGEVMEARERDLILSLLGRSAP
jgi:hypothetical protein